MDTAVCFNGINISFVTRRRVYEILIKICKKIIGESSVPPKNIDELKNNFVQHISEVSKEELYEGECPG